MTASHAFLARARVPDTIPGPRKPVCDTDPARRGGIDLNEVAQREYRQQARARRTYSVTFKRDLMGWGLHWTLTITGSGHWCEGSNGTGGPGLGGKFRSEAEAHAAGKRWIETGRMK